MLFGIVDVLGFRYRYTIVAMDKVSQEVGFNFQLPPE
jgi:hypothetical protein